MSSPAGASAGAGAPRGGRTVAVLKGGRSLERQVSLRSGARVEDALERLGHEVVGSPASRIACLATTLSEQRMQADTPDAV